MELSGVPDEVEIVTRRVSFLSELDDGPSHKSELADALGHSRSTVDRAIKSLEEAGYVERTDDGYVRTQAGRLAAERYRRFLDDQQRLLDAREILAPVPSDCELPTAILSNASIEQLDGSDQLFDTVSAHLDVAHTYRVLLPPSADPSFIRYLREEADDDVSLELVVPDGFLAENVDSDSDTDAVETTASPPSGYALLLWSRTDEDGDVDRTLSVVTYDDRETVGLVTTDDERAVAWATGVLQAPGDAEPEIPTDTQASS
jgi:DNA-binding transcriptional ArsR family regulator